MNTDIAPGRYYADPSSGCYWERQRATSGSLSDIIANEFLSYDATQWIVDILPSDVAFKTETACGTWFSTPRLGAQGPAIADGMWLVGAQIQPGTYRVNAGSGCYWARLRGFDGTLSEIIVNDFISGGGQAIVTISSSDVGFENDGRCGIWQLTTASGVMAERSQASTSVATARALAKGDVPIRR